MYKTHSTFLLFQIKFNETMRTLGDLVKDDIKLGTLYFFLLLATPSSSSPARVGTNSIKIFGPNSRFLLNFILGKP